MPTLVWIAWVAGGTFSGALAWTIARWYTHKPLLPVAPAERWTTAGALIYGLALGGVLAACNTALEGGIHLLVLTALLGAISLVDIYTRRIPDVLNLALLIWALVSMVWAREPSFIASGAGLLLAGGFFFLLALIGRGAMGLGDVKLAAVLGALLGFPLVLIALAAGIFAGGAAALVYIIAKKSRHGATMAYGPYLALGGWLAALGALFGWWY